LLVIEQIIGLAEFPFELVVHPTGPASQQVRTVAFVFAALGVLPMRELPRLFSVLTVHATLEGRKTLKRRQQQGSALECRRSRGRRGIS
jgi:hypothetical protein